jgi:hypothetical protein
VGSAKYGIRQFQIQGQALNASTAGNTPLGAWQYLPALTTYQAIDFHSEQIKTATLVYPASIATAASTLAGGSVIIAASQFSSLAASVNSATFYNQAAASQAAGVVDVSTLMKWTLSPGDYIVLYANTNTVGVPANLGPIILSGTIDSVTAG